MGRGLLFVVSDFEEHDSDFARHRQGGVEHERLKLEAFGDAPFPGKENSFAF